jgi:hypothetical protein
MRRIADAVFKELEHPLVIDFVEKASDVCLNDLVDILLTIFHVLESLRQASIF